MNECGFFAATWVPDKRFALSGMTMKFRSIDEHFSFND